MLYGIGCDLCEIAHLEKSLTGAHAAAFIRRVYGEAERAALSLDEPLPAGRSAAHRLASAAANFAAKEAVLKAAGTGLREPFSLCEIEAVRLESGAPAYHFSGQTAEWMQAHGLAAVGVDEGDQILADLAAENLLDDVHGLLVGIAEPVDEHALLADLFQHGGDFGAAAMDNNHLNAHLVQ